MDQEFSVKTVKGTFLTVRKSDFNYHFYFVSFGVKIGFTTNSPDALNAVKKAVNISLAGCYKEIEETETDHDFLFIWGKRGRDTLYRNGENVVNLEKRENSADRVGSEIRLTVAEFAVGYVFIHAGVVAWKNKGVIIPGRSFKGKTTLTADLVERGAIYYSDEYAILDADGFLHPFSKMLSVRGEIDEYKQIDYPVEKFGGVAGTEKIRTGIILLCDYKHSSRWKPEFLTPANGIVQIIQHTVPIRQNPQFALRVLQKVASEAVIVKSTRPDVLRSADTILQFIDQNI